MSTNRYSAKFKSKTDSQLVKILTDRNSFNELAIIASIKELKTRNIPVNDFITEDEIKSLTEKIEISLTKSSNDIVSKPVIYTITFLLSPVFSLPFLIFNCVIRKTNKGIIHIAVLSLLYAVCIIVLNSILKGIYPLLMSLITIFFHCSYSIMFIEYIWVNFLKLGDS
jgi:hypothetical protein